MYQCDLKLQLVAHDILISTGIVGITMTLAFNTALDADDYDPQIVMACISMDLLLVIPHIATVPINGESGKVFGY